MSSVKNLLVVVMLMGVSYGAFQVINSPEPVLEEAEMENLDIQNGNRQSNDSMFAENPVPIDSSGQTFTPERTTLPPPSNSQFPPLPPEARDSGTSSFVAKQPTPPSSGSFSKSSSSNTEAELSLPELTVPDLAPANPGNGSSLASGFSRDPAALAPPSSTPPFNSQPKLPPTNPPPTQNIAGSGSFQTPPAIAPPSPTASPLTTPRNDGQFAQNEIDTSSFVPPSENLRPINPKPTENQLAPTGFVQDVVNSTNQFASNARQQIQNQTQSTGDLLRQAMEQTQQQVQDTLINPTRGATDILDQATSQLKGDANQLIQNAGSTIGEVATNVREMVPQLQRNVAPITTDLKVVDWQGINNMAGEGQVREALQQLSQHYHADLNQEDRLRMLEWLDMLAGQVIYSTEHFLHSRPYVVKDGDSLDSLANAWNVPAQLIYNINQQKIPSTEFLTAGTELKMIQGPFSAEISLNRQEMTLFLSGMYAGRFPIELGADGNGIPHGRFMVEQKQLGQDYVMSTGQTLAAGSADNPYGKYWIGLGEPKLAIHESNPAQGQSDTRGSIRLSSRDVADVFGILSNGSQITISR